MDDVPGTLLQCCRGKGGTPTNIINVLYNPGKYDDFTLHVDHDRVYNRHVVGIIMMSFDVCLERSSLNVGWRKVKDTPISATYVLPSDVSSQA